MHPQAALTPLYSVGYVIFTLPSNPSQDSGIIAQDAEPELFDLQNSARSNQNVSPTNNVHVNGPSSSTPSGNPPVSSQSTSIPAVPIFTISSEYLSSNNNNYYSHVNGKTNTGFNCTTGTGLSNERGPCQPILCPNSTRPCPPFTFSIPNSMEFNRMQSISVPAAYLHSQLRSTVSGPLNNSYPSLTPTNSEVAVAPSDSSNSLVNEEDFDDDDDDCDCVDCSRLKMKQNEQDTNSEHYSSSSEYNYCSDDDDEDEKRHYGFNYNCSCDCCRQKQKEKQKQLRCTCPRTRTRASSRDIADDPKSDDDQDPDPQQDGHQRYHQPLPSDRDRTSSKNRTHNRNRKRPLDNNNCDPDEGSDVKGSKRGKQTSVNALDNYFNDRDHQHQQFNKVKINAENIAQLKENSEEVIHRDREDGDGTVTRETEHLKQTNNAEMVVEDQDVEIEGQSDNDDEDDDANDDEESEDDADDADADDDEKDLEEEAPTDGCGSSGCCGETKNINVVIVVKVQNSDENDSESEDEDDHIDESTEQQTETNETVTTSEVATAIASAIRGSLEPQSSPLSTLPLAPPSGQHDDAPEPQPQQNQNQQSDLGSLPPQGQQQQQQQQRSPLFSVGLPGDPLLQAIRQALGVADPDNEEEEEDGDDFEEEFEPIDEDGENDGENEEDEGTDEADTRELFSIARDSDYRGRLALVDNLVLSYGKISSLDEKLNASLVGDVSHVIIGGFLVSSSYITRETRKAGYSLGFYLDDLQPNSFLLQIQDGILRVGGRRDEMDLVLRIEIGAPVRIEDINVVHHKATNVIWIEVFF